MRIGILNATVFCDDRRRRLLADAGNSRNVIGSIPHKSFHFDNLIRTITIEFLHIIKSNL